MGSWDDQQMKAMTRLDLMQCWNTELLRSLIRVLETKMPNLRAAIRQDLVQRAEILDQAGAHFTAADVSELINSAFFTAPDYMGDALH